jgi:outer membrane protein
MRRFAVALAVLASLTTSASAESPLMVRLRGVYIAPADRNDAVTGVPNSADTISVSTKFIPEVDFSYFFLPNLSAELILTYPQQHDVKLDALGKLGTVTHLPPCLTAQWHFLPGAVANAYVGAGVNLTLVTSQKLSAGGNDLELGKTSFGFAGQVGADFKVADQIFLNVDVKYVTPLGFDVKVKSTGQKISHVDLNPWLLGAGVGYRF